MAKKVSEAVAEERFEEGLSELERIVASLESGELPLEAALQVFEQGVTLVNRLNGRLGDAERRIEVLTRNANGDLDLRKLVPEGDEP